MKNFMLFASVFAVTIASASHGQLVLRTRDPNAPPPPRYGYFMVYDTRTTFTHTPQEVREEEAIERWCEGLTDSKGKYGRVSRLQSHVVGGMTRVLNMCSFSAPLTLNAQGDWPRLPPTALLSVKPELCPSQRAGDDYVCINAMMAKYVPR